MLGLVEQADALIEGFRPGVTERLGLGPDVCLARNPRLAYGRLTGWGQSGPLAQVAGHDINYLAITGILEAIGREGQPPSIPLNLLGDYAGGSLYMAVGLLAAILEARRTGPGPGRRRGDRRRRRAPGDDLPRHGRRRHLARRPRRQPDATAARISTTATSAPTAAGSRSGRSRRSSSPSCSPGWRSTPSTLGPQMSREHWKPAKALLAATFRTRTRDDWAARLEQTDACVSPVLSFAEATRHPHLKARGSLVEIDGIVQSAPAPRFSRSTPATPTPPQPVTPANTDRALSAWFSRDKIAALRRDGVID